MDKRSRFDSIYFPFRLLTLYIVGINLWRLLFLFYNDVPQKTQTIIAGFRLDISMICGIFLVSFLPWLLFLIFGKDWIKKIILYLNILLWIGICIVEYSSVIIYKEWGTSLDSRAISYLKHPNEAWASSKDFIPFWATVFGLLILISGIKRISRIFASWEPVKSHYLQTFIFVLLCLVGSMIGIRGGLQKLPVTPSDAFFSTDMRSNFAATNKIWYFIYSITKKTELSYHNSIEDIQGFVQEYQLENEKIDTSNLLFKGKNIVLLINEGWSADMTKYLGGSENVTPFFDSLSQYSLRCTNTFSTGFRTDQGLMNILSGMPSIHSLNMPNAIDKVNKYPSLCKEIEALGYQSSFVYGGDLNFSNLYNYLVTQGFDTIISDQNFPSSDDITEWGVPDHIMLKKAVEILDHQRQTFFSTILLMSSHSPFDVPWQNEFKGSDIPSKYKSSVRYSDQSLKQFFKESESKPWFANTVFIITSDHGSTHSGWAGMEDHNRFRIPFIIFDPSKPWSEDGQENSICNNHFDVASTVLNGMGLQSDKFIFSRNMMSDGANYQAYWNIDIASGCFGKDHQEVINLNKVQNPKSKSVLFLDAVKLYFNQL